MPLSLSPASPSPLTHRVGSPRPRRSRPAVSGPLAALLLATALVGTMMAHPASVAAQDSPQVTLEKATDGVDADGAPGPSIEPGVGVTWTWTITASGSTTLYDLVVTDSSGVSPNCDVTGDGQPDGTSIHPGPLDPGQSFRCSATGAADHPAGADPFAATGSVRATDFAATGDFRDSDASHHVVTVPFAPAPDLGLSTLINGQPADGPTGPLVAENEPITVTYVVANTGNVPLRGIEVGGPEADIDCGDGSAIVAGPVQPGESVSCRTSAIAAAVADGPQATTISAVASAVDPTSGVELATLDASDPSVYTPVQFPSQLAFTGPTDQAVPVGLALMVAGLALLIVARASARREALRPIPVRADSTGGPPPVEDPEPTL